MSDGLELRSVTVQREGAKIVRGVDLVAPRGQVTVLLGPNGAGKTTLLEAISGIVGSSGGEIILDGSELNKVARYRRARLGLGHVEQGRAIFGELTVNENIAVAAKDAAGHAAASQLFPELEPRHDTQAGLLSGGEQQMVVIARALAAEPTLLLIDEMSLGLAPVIVQRLMPRVRQLADEGIGVLLVEQFAALALSIGDSAYVMSRGEIRHSGPCADLVGQTDVLRGAYFGGTGKGATESDDPSAS